MPDLSAVAALLRMCVVLFPEVAEVLIAELAA